jgi:hypothetical protein
MVVFDRSMFKCARVGFATDKVIRTARQQTGTPCNMFPMMNKGWLKPLMALVLWRCSCGGARAQARHLVWGNNETHSRFVLVHLLAQLPG